MNLSGTSAGRFLFLSLGLSRVFWPRREGKKSTGPDRISETEGSRICRRNILALASVIVVAGLADADPRDLSVFGIGIDGERALTVIGVAVIAAHLYWYWLRYCHLWEDGVIESVPPVRIKGHDSVVLVQKSASLFSNWIAFLMTLASWYFVIGWIVEAWVD